MTPLFRGVQKGERGRECLVWCGSVGTGRMQRVFVVCCLLFVVCCLLFVVCCLLFVVCCLLFVVCCLLFVVCCLLFVVCCLLFVVCCLLFVVCCLLFVVCCFFILVDHIHPAQGARRVTEATRVCLLQHRGEQDPPRLSHMVTWRRRKGRQQDSWQAQNTSFILLGHILCGGK